MIHDGTLLQNAIDIITKCDSCFIKKCDRTSLQSAPGFLLPDAVVITSCDIYYKLRQFTYLLIHLNSLANIL